MNKKLRMWVDFHLIWAEIIHTFPYWPSVTKFAFTLLASDTLMG